MIKYCIEDDPNVFMEIENQCFDEGEAFDKYMYENLINNSRSINIVAFDGDVPVGSISTNPSSENKYYIYSIGVIASHRRMGIATNLLNIILDKIGDSCSIWLHVKQSNISAVNLYTLKGFNIESVMNGYYQDESAYIMLRKSTYSE